MLENDNKNLGILKKQNNQSKTKSKHIKFLKIPKLDFSIPVIKTNLKEEFTLPIRREKKEKTTKTDSAKVLELLGNKKKITHKRNLQRTNTIDADSKNQIFKLSSFEQDEEFMSNVIKILKTGPSDEKDSRKLISFLYNLKPFNQIFSEGDKKEIQKIISNLISNLKYEYFPKNKIIYKFGQNYEKFFLILRGKVDILVPNEEEILLTDEEYYRYLLNLRIYNENNIINKIISKNYMTFIMEEKNFDEWIKTAYNTLELLEKKMPINKNSNKNDIFKKNFNLIDNEKKTQNNSQNKKRLLSAIQQRKNNTLIKLPKSPEIKRRLKKLEVSQNELEKKKVFDSLEKKNTVLRLKEQIQVAMKIIDPDNADLLGINISDYTTNNVTTEQYIKRTKPFKFNYNLNELEKPAKIISYFIANSLKTGDKFGDMISDSVTSNNNEKYCTIITSENCDFGTLNKNGYFKCLQDIEAKMRKQKLKFLLSLPIFKGCNNYFFKKKFSSFFTKRLVYSHEELFKENEEVQNQIIYFIRDGEFILTCYKNIYEINKLFIDLKYNDFVDPEDEDDCLDKQFDDYIRFKKKKNLYKIQYFKENDVIGLNDCILNNKYIYSATCTSSTAIVYEIHINFLKLIMNSDKIIKDNITYEEMVKRNLSIKLLLKNRNDRIKYYKYYSKGGDVLNFGCLTTKGDDKNSFRKLLVEKEKAKKGEFVLRSIHKRKLNCIIDKTKELYIKNPEIFTIRQFPLIGNGNENENENEREDNSKSRNIHSDIKLKNINLSNTMKLNEKMKNKIISTKEDLRQIFTNKINKKNKINETSTFYSISNKKSNIIGNLSERNKYSNIENYSDSSRIINQYRRKDNTLLPIKYNGNDNVIKTKLILKRIPNFYSNERTKNHKKTIFNMTNKSMYKSVISD